MKSIRKYFGFAVLLIACLILGSVIAVSCGGVGGVTSVASSATATPTTSTVLATNKVDTTFVSGVSGYDGYGRLADGSKYYYTNSALVDNFRAGTVDNDASYQDVNVFGTRGTMDNPYVITNVTQWNQFAGDTTNATNAAKVFVLGANIDFQGQTFTPVPNFSGKFFGCDYALFNINKQWTDTGNCGVFQNIAATATIADLSLSNLVFTKAGVHNGMLCGHSLGGIILNCHAQGSITRTATGVWTATGGIIGRHDGASTLLFYRCSTSFNMDIYGGHSSGNGAGGILGCTYSGGRVTFYDCYARVYLRFQGPTDLWYGAIGGFGESNNYCATIENCMTYTTQVDAQLITGTSHNNPGTLYSGSGTKSGVTFTAKNTYSSGISTYTNNGTDTIKSMVPVTSYYAGGFISTPADVSDLNWYSEYDAYAIDPSYGKDWLDYKKAPNIKYTSALNYDGKTGEEAFWLKARDDASFSENIWVNRDVICLDYVHDDNKNQYNVWNSPVRSPLIVRVKYIDYSVSDGETVMYPNASEDNWFTVVANETLKDPTVDLGYTPKNYHEFVGWTTDLTGESTPFNKVKGLLGDVKLYAVWSVDSAHVTATVTPSVNSGTLTWNAGDTTASSVYAPGRTVTLTANPITVASMVGYTIDTNAIKYQWIKDTSDIDKAITKAYANIKEVKDSNSYSYSFIIHDTDEPLWMFKGTSSALQVNVNPPTLTTTALTTEQTAYIGKPYNEVTPNATMKDPYNNIISGTTSWKYNVGSIQEDSPTVPGYVEGYVWAEFTFVPDDPNYGNGKDSSGSFIPYEYQFKIEYLQIVFSMSQLSGDTVSENIIYNGDLSYRTVANKFDTAFAAYYAQNATVFDRILAGQTPTFKVGSDFVNINTYRAYSGYAFEDVTETVNIEVLFKPENYTITYKFNDTIGTPDAHETGKKYNEQLSEPATPTNGNLLFTGWYYDVIDESTGNTTPTRWDFDNRITGDLTLDAHWLEANDLDRIEITKNKATYTATNPIVSGDLTVTAYYKGELDGQTIIVPVVLTWSEFSSNIVYDPVSDFATNPSSSNSNGNDGYDGKLHVLLDTDGVTKIPFTVGVYYSFGSNTAKATIDLDITPVEIDLSDLVIPDKKVTYNGSAQSVDSISIAQIQALADPNSSYINKVNYKYRLGRNEIDQTNVINIGNYNVEISFETIDPDYSAKSINVGLQILAEADILTLTWDKTTFQYNAKVQHPEPIFADADGNVLTNILYHLDGDNDKSARGSYSITVVIDTAGYTLSGSDTTAFTITKATLDVPTIKSETSIIYTGQPLNLEDYLDGFDPDIMEIIDGGIKTDANNNYVATISLKDIVNCEWKGITSQTVTVNWAIEKAHLTAGWDSSEHVADGQVFQPVVDRFLAGLSDVDKPAVDFANDLLYAGDLNMSAIGAYSITVSLNASAAWTKNYILDGNATWAYVIVPHEGMDVITIEWDQTQFTFNGSVQKPNYTVFDKNGNDITAQVAPVLTLGGDVNISKWAGDYTAQATVADTSNYFIRSGAVCNYTIVVDPVTGEGVDPGSGNEGNNGGGNGGGSFIDKLLASHFPLWQVATMAVAGILSLIFVIKAAQYGSRAKKAKGEAKKISSRAYAAFLPIFSTTPVALGLSNQIWSIMAFAFVGLALLLFVVAMIMRSNWKKAELAKENAIDEREQRKYEAQNASQLALQEKIAQASIAGGAGQSTSDSIAIIEAMRREMDERRREDEERHRKEMEALREEQAKRDDAMKMMLANMMGRGSGEDGFAYASIDDTDMLVQRVIAGLLPAMQQMMPEPTAYLAAPQEQNEELLHIVEEQNAQMQAMSEQMSELQEQLAAMHEMADAVVIQDNNEELRAMTDEVNALRQQIENLGSQPAAVVAADNSDELRAMSDEMNALREQIANIGSQQVTVVAADNSEDMKAVTDEMNALRAQVAKLSDSQLEMSILDDEDDDDFSFDDEEEWDSILDEEDDETFVESVIVEADGTVRKVYPNFRMRLKQSSDKNREWYAAIKNLFCSQKGVTYRVYKRVEKIRYQGNVIAVIGIAKRSIKLWLALKPFEYDARRYHHKDVSDKPRFVDVPLYVRVGSDRALTRAQELILALFQEQSMEARKRYTDRDIQELIFTLKYNKLLTKKGYKQLLCQSIHVHDCDILSNEVAEKCIESKNVDFIDDSVIETVKLDDIDAKFQDGNRVTLDRLRKLGLVSEDCTGYVVAADKRLTKPLIIVANDFTMDAVKMIVLTGGRVIRLEQVNK